MNVPFRTVRRVSLLACLPLLLILAALPVAAQSPPGIAADSAPPPPATGDGPAAENIDAEGSSGAVEAQTEARQEPARPQEPARRTYMGRVVAAPMSHLGADWLTRPSRQQEENPDLAMRQLRVVEGMTVCDMGCGNGYWTLRMAEAVGDSGRVLAVDIQPEMLAKLMQRCARLDIDHVQPVLGAVDDPRLPAGEVDLVLMVDVYHEFSHPQSMLWAIRRSLEPRGVVALLEYRAEDPTVPIKPLHKMSKRQIMKEYEANGFKLVREFNGLPWQHLMFFARDDSPLPAIEPSVTER